MSKPSWERQRELDDLETERRIDEQGEREAEQMYWNRMEGDYLGLEDGRPGIGQGVNLWGSFFTMPPMSYIGLRILLRLVPFLLIAAIAFGISYCSGEARTLRMMLNSQTQQAP